LRRVYTNYHYFLLAFGCILLVVAWHPRTPLAQIASDITPPQIMNVYPSGTANEPTAISPAGNLSIYLDAIEDNPNVTTVTITANLTGYSKILQLSKISVITYSKGNATRFGTTWTVPEDAGVKYRFYWYINDKANHENSTTTYAITEAEAPQGFFTINGYKIPESETLWLDTLELTIGYWCVKYPDVISSVKIEIYWQENESLLVETLLTKLEDNYWDTNYTLPKDLTTYIVYGYVTTVKEKEYKQLSIYLNFKLPEEMRVISIADIYRIVFTVLACSAIYLGARGRVITVRRRKRRRR